MLNHHTTFTKGKYLSIKYLNEFCFHQFPPNPRDSDAILAL